MALINHDDRDIWNIRDKGKTTRTTYTPSVKRSWVEKKNSNFQGEAFDEKRRIRWMTFYDGRWSCSGCVIISN